MPEWSGPGWFLGHPPDDEAELDAFVQRAVEAARRAPARHKWPWAFVFAEVGRDSMHVWRPMFPINRDDDDAWADLLLVALRSALREGTALEVTNDRKRELRRIHV
jgi:hypothetical protein